MIAEWNLQIKWMKLFGLREESLEISIGVKWWMIDILPLECNSIIIEHLKLEMITDEAEVIADY